MFVGKEKSCDGKGCGQSDQSEERVKCVFLPKYLEISEMFCIFAIEWVACCYQHLKERLRLWHSQQLR